MVDYGRSIWARVYSDSKKFLEEKKGEASEKEETSEKETSEKETSELPGIETNEHHL
jgi:hypothetical protein